MDPVRSLARDPVASPEDLGGATSYGMDSLLYITDTLRLTFTAIGLYWWIWLPVILFIVFYESFKKFNQAKYLSGLKWVLLEVRFPAEAHRSLKAMEQIFAALHAIALPSSPKTIADKYRKWKATLIEGKIQDWVGLEIVSISGEIHFYFRVIEKYRNLVEAQVYAHYPESEITPVPDYLSQVPAVLPAADMDVTGVELGLTKDNAFPLIPYEEFEEKGGGKDDIRRIDPLGPLAEAMNMLAPKEYLGVQILIRSTGDGWIKKAQPALDKLWERPEKKEGNLAEKVLTGFESAAGSVRDSVTGAEAAEPKKEEKKEGKKFNELGPGTQDTIKAIEHNFTKLAFETTIRVMYAAPRDRFDGSGRIRPVAAAFKQFSSQALNGFKPAFSVDVEKGFGKEKKTAKNKPKFYKRYRNREFVKTPFILTTEELATIFHFPDISVKTPSLPRIEAKKGEPPAGLPTV